MTSPLGGRVGVSQKVTNRDGGEGGAGLFSKPKVTPCTVGHFWEGGSGLTVFKSPGFLRPGGHGLF